MVSAIVGQDRLAKEEAAQREEDVGDNTLQLRSYKREYVFVYIFSHSFSLFTSITPVKQYWSLNEYIYTFVKNIFIHLCVSSSSRHRRHPHHSNE